MGAIGLTQRLRAQGNTITLRWLPTHRWVVGNEQAEQEVVASILHYLLQAKTRTWKVILCRKDCSCTPPAALQTL